MNKTPVPVSPIKPKPMEEVMALVGLSAKYSTKKNSPSDSPLVPIPMLDVLRMLQANKQLSFKNNTALSDKKKKIKNIPNKDIQQSTSVKISKKLSLINNKGNNAANPRRETAISNKPRDNHLKPVSQVRKALFSGERTPIVKTAIPKIVKDSKPKVSFVIGSKCRKQTPNKNKRKPLTDKSKDVDNSNNTIKSSLRGKQNEYLSNTKLSNSIDDEFELVEYLCKLPNSSNAALKIRNFHHLQELLQKQQALSVEINEVWQRIYSAIAITPNTNSKNVKSRFTKVASAKKVNLLKAALLKTVQEVPVCEAVSDKTSERVVKQPFDVEMIKSITMYNTMRSQFLQTPKRTRQSLEHGDDSISTTIQKQCLLLMDTPKV